MRQSKEIKQRFREVLKLYKESNNSNSLILIITSEII